MNRERARTLLPIIQAFAEGRTIQAHLNNGEWIDIEHDADLETDHKWRIKPEPREFWITFNEHGNPVYAFDSKEEVTASGFDHFTKAREVLDD